MIMINLLPHREERRRRKKIAFYAGLAVAAFAGVAIVGVWYLVVQQLISGQQQRNAFLSAEIAKLDIQIKDIASLKAEIASLKARQKAVEDLQIDRNVPVVVLAPRDGLFDKTVSNMQEVMARHGQVLLISDAEGVEKGGQGVHDSLTMPTGGGVFQPILYAVPMQYLAYHTAVAKGTDVDQPRNLAKSVTVE